MSGRVDIPAPVAALLKRAMAATSAKRGADAIECLAAASVLDVQQHQQRFLATAQTAGVVADLYRDALRVLQASEQTMVCSPRRLVTPSSRHPRPLRIAYVLFQLMPGQAATRRVLNLAKHHRRELVEPVVIVTEDLCRRTPPTASLVLPDEPSAVSGAAIINELRSLNTPVHIVPTTGTHADGGLAAARLMRELDLDVAVYLGGPTTAVQVVAAAARGAPVQVNLNIGVPMLSPGIDAVIYTNPARQQADAAELKARGVRVMGVECSGCDARGAADAPEADRGVLGLPARGSGAVVCVTASNKLDIRMREADGVFARDLARFLSAHPQAWWVGIGRGDVAGALGAVRDVGAMDRVVLTGGLPDIRPVLKACDVYLNEYPEGGYNTVVESMAAGTPVVALAASSRHADCAGAQLVGAADAIDGFDREAYWAKASAWVRDAESRCAAAERQRERALLRFDYEAVCRRYEDMFAELAAAGERDQVAPSAIVVR